MAYNPKYNAQHEEYRREKYKRVGIDFEKGYYENVLKPAADKHGLSVSGFIKSAITEKLEKEMNS